MSSTPEIPTASTLPASFRWGVATSAYQIEGATSEDGRTESIWDVFARTPDAVAHGHTGETACDHYHRMPEDVALIASLGVDTYRFSLSWPRIQPGGTGPLNARGVDFYDRLVDELLAAGVDPWVTLYHWDLPQELEDKGGWPHRDTAHRFADYAELAFARLSDRVSSWTTLNEPWCVAVYGYADGMHAPGRRDRAAAMSAAHHLLLGHGEAVARLRERADPGRHSFGITLNLTTVAPATGAAADVVRRQDGLANRMYLDPLLRGRYPGDVLHDLAQEGVRLPVAEADLDLISVPLDFLGVNYYFTETVDPTGRPVRTGPMTGLGWPITPSGLTDLLVRLHREYPPTALVITENGAAFPDRPSPDGVIADHDRVDFLRAHVDAVAAAHALGVDVRGYFVWTLLDNFEWAHGYDPRFGLIAVDRRSQRRTPKRSAHWYRALIDAHRSSRHP